MCIRDRYELMDLFESRGNDMFLELMEQKEKELLQESVSMSLRLHSIHLSLECIALAERAQHAIQLSLIHICFSGDCCLSWRSHF